MLSLSPDLLRSFKVFDVYDPDELAEGARRAQRFAGTNTYNTYRPRDCGEGERPSGLFSRLASRREGWLELSYIDSLFATEIGIVGDGSRGLFLTFSLAGGIALAAGVDPDAVAAGSRGLVYRGVAGTRLLTTDNNQRITVLIDEARLLRTLESLLDDICPRCPSFVPEVDWADPAVAPIARMVQHMLGEVGDPMGLFSLPPAMETFTDTLVHLVLARLPHQFSERLHAPRSPAIPRQLRRAEAFIEAHANQPIAIADIAAAAGCGARTLQVAFRKFRGTTPLAALQAARLRAVRAALAASGAPAAAVAREFGFSNATRFRAAFRRQFGEAPPGRR